MKSFNLTEWALNHRAIVLFLILAIMLHVVDIVQVRGTTDFFGHRYFVSNPKVSADIIAMLRYDLRPNDPGRPLEHVAGSFWRVPGQ